MLLLRHISFGFALLGLILAPLASPAMAVPVHTHAVVGDQAAMPMEMPCDMPCCPDGVPGPHGAKDCPLMALCIAGSILTLPANVALLFPLEHVTLALSGNDPDIAGLSPPPLARPPKA